MAIESQKINPNYHHGNVKGALLDAAQNHIENNDGEMISLRALSRQVGITPSAVYNHFSDKNALMRAIKIRFFETFNEFFEKSCNSNSTPEQSLLEMCIAYFRFSRKYPSQFRFLFSSSLFMECSTAEIVDVTCRGIVKVRGLVFEIHQQHQTNCTEEELVNITLLIWSQLHGIVTLRNSGSIGAAVNYQNWSAIYGLDEDAQVEKLIKHHVQIMVSGMLNKDYSKKQQ